MELQHTEAKTLSFTKIITPAGYTHSITVRQGASDSDIKTQLTNIKRLDTALQQMDWQPAEGRRATGHSNGSNSPAPAPVANANGSQPREIDIFDCQSLACTVDQGKQYWKISDASHRWKYPVIIYPEILKLYLDPNTLDTDTTYNLSGWKAVFERNDKGYPKKVVALYPPGETPEQPQPQQVQRPAAGPPLPPPAQMLQHSDPERYGALVAAGNGAAKPVEDEIPF
ncbi:MAG: hypothetical protein GY792_05595 [Gammaproteobacteria bacterium]|nr:hypothetical protein [Gammaproteobacteria bacterium]